MIGQEVEMKYNAANITPEHFKAFCLSKKPEYILTVSGFDTFYANPNDPQSFFRYRESDASCELTFKRKTQDNNVVRIEHNLPLVYPLPDKAAGFCSDMGYELNTTIFKMAFIYEYEMHILCYYIVYDTALIELGRFIEIELNEHIEWESEASARSALYNLEKGCYGLGLTPLNRVNASLFEMFRSK